MYKIIKDSFGRYGCHHLKNIETGEYVEIITDFGAMINGFYVRNNGTLTSVLQGYKDEKELQDLFYSTFRGSKLSPFPNRIKGGSYDFEGHKYQLDVNFPHEGHAIHGLMLCEPFKVVSQADGEEAATLTLAYEYQGKRQGYPFYYSIVITYSYGKGNVFSAKTKITNNDNVDIPIGDGWHPYFTTGSKADELEVYCPSREVVNVDETLIPIGGFKKNGLFTKPETVGDRFIDNTFLIDSANGSVKSYLVDKKNKLKITLWQESGEGKYKYLHIFTPPHRESLALEPVTCPANAFNNKQDLLILKPEETLSLSWEIAVETIA